MSEFMSPYAHTLGLTVAREGERLVVTMPANEGTAGRPGFLHGGAIGGLLDHTGWVTLLDALGDEGRIKPIGITVDFMRGGRMELTHAAAQIERLGRRVANILAFAWQDDEAKPIASANFKFLIER
jgi:uncharacterized protein (TIGR00369 family)